MRKFLRLALFCQMSFFTLITSVQSESTAHWRFAHFAPDTSALNVFVNGERTGLQGIEFSDVSGWQQVAAGSYDIVIMLEGENTALFSLTLEISAGEWATVAADGIGELIRGQVIYEDFSPLDEDSARLTLFTSTQDESGVDVLVNGEPIARNLRVSADDPEANTTTVELAAATYDIQVTRAGEINEVLLDADRVEILPKRNYLLAAVETEADPRLFVIETATNTTEQSEGNALLRVAHLSSGTPSLDVYINDQLTSFADLSFPEVSKWTVLPSGLIPLVVTLEGETPEDAVIPPIDLTLEADSYTTVAIIGTLENETLEARILTEDYSQLAPGFVRVNVLNAHPGLGPINIQSDEGESFIEELGYPGFFGTNTGFNQFIVETGTYDLQVSESESGETVFDLPGTNLFEGRNYFISVIVANPPFILTFSDVEETQRLLGE